MECQVHPLQSNLFRYSSNNFMLKNKALIFRIQGGLEFNMPTFLSKNYDVFSEPFLLEN